MAFARGNQVTSRGDEKVRCRTHSHTSRQAGVLDVHDVEPVTVQNTSGTCIQFSRPHNHVGSACPVTPIQMAATWLQFTPTSQSVQWMLATSKVCCPMHAVHPGQWDELWSPMPGGGVGALVADASRHGKGGDAGTQQTDDSVDNDVELLAQLLWRHIQHCSNITQTLWVHDDRDVSLCYQCWKCNDWSRPCGIPN